MFNIISTFHLPVRPVRPTPPLCPASCSHRASGREGDIRAWSGSAVWAWYGEVPVRRAFRNASNVESQESCIHPMLSHTARARPVLRCFPLLSRQNYRKENGYQYGYKNGYKYGRSHVQSPTNSIRLPRRSRLGAQRTLLQDWRALCVLPVLTRYSEVDVLNMASGIDPP